MVKHLEGAWPAVKPGTRFRWLTFGVIVHSEVVEYSPFQRLAWSAKELGAAGHHGWVLTERDGGTFVRTEETQRGAMVGLMKPVMKPLMVRFHQRWLEGLARAAAQRTAAGKRLTPGLRHRGRRFSVYAPLFFFFFLHFFFLAEAALFLLLLLLALLLLAAALAGVGGRVGERHRRDACGVRPHRGEAGSGPEGARSAAAAAAAVVAAAAVAATAAAVGAAATAAAGAGADGARGCRRRPDRGRRC